MGSLKFASMDTGEVLSDSGEFNAVGSCSVSGRGSLRKGRYYRIYCI